MTMARETLRGYLHNDPLVQALEQKRAIDKTRRDLANAIATMRAVGVNDSAISEVQVKCDEYSKISKGYGNLIQDTWGVTWQKEAVILRYTDCEDSDIDRLPDIIKVA